MGDRILDIHDTLHLGLDTFEIILGTLVDEPGLGLWLVFEHIVYSESSKDRCLCLLISFIEKGLVDGILLFIAHYPIEKVLGGRVTATATTESHLFFKHFPSVAHSFSFLVINYNLQFFPFLNTP